MPAPVSVVCAMIFRDDRVLIAQRPDGKHLAQKWEFPGGKVEPGEQPDAALVREIREELGCDIIVREAWPSLVHRYERGEIELMPFVCELRLESEEPHPHEHAAVKWVRVSELPGFDLAEADLTEGRPPGRSMDGRSSDPPNLIWRSIVRSFVRRVGKLADRCQVWRPDLRKGARPARGHGKALAPRRFTLICPAPFLGAKPQLSSRSWPTSPPALLTRKKRNTSPTCRRRRRASF